jgi:hypothetical protein
MDLKVSHDDSLGLGGPRPGGGEGRTDVAAGRCEAEQAAHSPDLLAVIMPA